MYKLKYAFAAFRLVWLTESAAFSYFLSDTSLTKQYAVRYVSVFCYEKETLNTFEILPKFGKGLFLLANTVFLWEIKVEGGERSQYKKEFVSGPNL